MGGAGALFFTWIPWLVANEGVTASHESGDLPLEDFKSLTTPGPQGFQSAFLMVDTFWLEQVLEQVPTLNA